MQYVRHRTKRYIGKLCPGGCGDYCSWNAKLCRECFKKAIAASKVNNPTKNQMKVLQVWSKSGSIKVAANELNLSNKTVEFHLLKLRERLSLTTLYELMAWGFRKGHLR